MPGKNSSFFYLVRHNKRGFDVRGVGAITADKIFENFHWSFMWGEHPEMYVNNLYSRIDFASVCWEKEAISDIRYYNRNILLIYQHDKFFRLIEFV